VRQGDPILLVEDDATDVTVALRAFRKHGLGERVVVARDGQEALDYLGLSDGPDAGEPILPRVIFLDLKMPRVDGFEVLRTVRSDERLAGVPVVVISSSERDKDIEASYRLGANSYVRKRLEPGGPGQYLVDAARYWLELNRTTHS
jgi:two-component system response regulator